MPAIVALTSHKTFSCPVDPIELKKRLSDLLIQRSAKGDQQAMELKVEMSQIYLSHSIIYYYIVISAILFILEKYGLKIIL